MSAREQFPFIDVAYTVHAPDGSIEHVGRFDPSKDGERRAWWERALQAAADGREVTIRRAPFATQFGAKITSAVNKRSAKK